jgi:hypothetical protein
MESGRQKQGDGRYGSDPWKDTDESTDEASDETEKEIIQLEDDRKS